MLAALPTASPWVIGDLVTALIALVNTDADRAEARAAVLAARPTGRPCLVGNLVAALRSVSSIQYWLASLSDD